MTAFIGESIYKGVLNVTTPPIDEETGKPQKVDPFIGFVEIPGMTNPMTGKAVKMMYFKDYSWDDSQPLKLKFNNMESGKEYHFDWCLMRIPPEFIYLVLTKDKTNVAIVRRDVENYYYGLTLVNIHETNNGSLASKTFIKPNHHYNTRVNKAVGGIRSGGLRGCKSLACFGTERVPLFGIVSETNEILDAFMMSIGTDGTVGYCQFQDLDDLKNRICLDGGLLQKASNPSRAAQRHKLGVALCAREYLEVDVSDTKYGVHIIPAKSDVTKLEAADAYNCKKDGIGWDFDWYEDIKYDK